MSISHCLKDYLDGKQIRYERVKHVPTDTSFNAAKSAHIPVQYMVKGVLLSDEEGYLLAAVAADRTLNIEAINQHTGRHLHLVEETELPKVFWDCAAGAVPALGEAYGITTFWDQQLELHPSFYIEAGDHEELLRLGYYDFMGLMGKDNGLTLSHHVGGADSDGY